MPRPTCRPPIPPRPLAPLGGVRHADGITRNRRVVALHGPPQRQATPGMWITARPARTARAAYALSATASRRPSGGLWATSWRRAALPLTAWWPHPRQPSRRRSCLRHRPGCAGPTPPPVPQRVEASSAPRSRRAQQSCDQDPQTGMRERGTGAATQKTTHELGGWSSGSIRHRTTSPAGRRGDQPDRRPSPSGLGRLPPCAGHDLPLPRGCPHSVGTIYGPTRCYHAGVHAAARPRAREPVARITRPLCGTLASGSTRPSFSSSGALTRYARHAGHSLPSGVKARRRGPRVHLRLSCRRPPTTSAWLPLSPTGQVVRRPTSPPSLCRRRSLGSVQCRLDHGLRRHPHAARGAQRLAATAHFSGGRVTAYVSRSPTSHSAPEPIRLRSPLLWQPGGITPTTTGCRTSHETFITLRADLTFTTLHPAPAVATGGAARRPDAGHPGPDGPTRTAWAHPVRF